PFAMSQPSLDAWRASIIGVYQVILVGLASWTWKHTQIRIARTGNGLMSWPATVICIPLRLMNSLSYMVVLRPTYPLSKYKILTAHTRIGFHRLSLEPGPVSPRQQAHR